MKEGCEVDGHDSEYPSHGHFARLSGRCDPTGNEQWPCEPEDRVDRGASAQGKEIRRIEACQISSSWSQNEVSYRSPNERGNHEGDRQDAHVLYPSGRRSGLPVGVYRITSTYHHRFKTLVQHVCHACEDTAERVEKRCAQSGIRSIAEGCSFTKSMDPDGDGHHQGYGKAIFSDGGLRG